MLLENLDKVNTLTKYPSILTYNKLAPKGKLTEEINEPFGKNDILYVYEKVNGTNTRMIFYKGDYLIGSRDKILYAKGDRIINDQMGIVEHLIPIAEKINKDLQGSTSLLVVYGEVFGGKIGRECKNYSSKNNFGYRVFDIVKYAESELEVLLKFPMDKLSNFRETTNNFLGLHDLEMYCGAFQIPLVPIVDATNIECIGGDIESIYKYISAFSFTQVGLDENGESEGVVIRTHDRSKIKKFRLEEYRKTLGEL